VWATLPPTIAPLIEWLSFRTHYLWDFVRYRSFEIWRILGLGPMPGFAHGHHRDVASAEFGSGHFAAAFSNIDLWLGVLAAVALLYAAARIRRFRDDS
jgi:hypothetical protein